MRITLITSKLNFKTAGGSVFDLHLKAKGLKELGHNVTVVTVFSRNNIIEEPLPYKVQEENIQAVGLLEIQKGGVKILRKYEKEADVYYIDGQIFIYAAGWYRMTGGKVRIVSFFNTRINCMGDTQDVACVRSIIGERFKKFLRYQFERLVGTKIANFTDHFIFNTPHVQKIYKSFGSAIEKSTILEDFVDTMSIINNNAITADRIFKHQSAEKRINLFAAGRMIKEKGFDMAIKAFLLLDNKEKHRFTICGGGSDEERLKKMVKELGLINYVTFPGWVTREELNKYFLNAHLFIFPKWWIEYGSAILTEAMAYGLPCIVPAGGGLAWLAGNSAVTFKDGDVEDLANKIEQLGSDSSLRVILAKNSLKRARELDYKILAKKLNFVVNSV